MSKTSTRPDAASINLSRLLARLEKVILSPDVNPHLQSSSYERAKVGANLEHARSLLLRLEHDSAAIKIQSKRQNIQTDLQTKRELIKQLNQRLYELNQIEDVIDDSSSDNGSLPSDDEPPPSYAPAIPSAANNIEYDREPSRDDTTRAEVADFMSNLRPRRPKESNEPTKTATSTGASLFGNNRQSADPKIAQNEALLSQNRTQQEALTSSLLSMAQQLKAQTVQFGASIESEKGVVDRAVEGLDRNTTGMQAAGQRMNALRRMTEGRGLVGRLFLYVSVAFLWIITILIVIMPAPTKDLIAAVGVILLFLGYWVWRYIDGNLPWGLS